MAGSAERPEGHYWTRYGQTDLWDVMFWRGGYFWDHHDCGYLPELFEIGPRVHPPGKGPDDDDAAKWRENVEAMLSSGDPDTIRCREGGGPESLIGSLVLTMMRTRNARNKLSEALAEVVDGTPAHHLAEEHAPMTIERAREIRKLAGLSENG